jgi:alanyl-tRNA synthetase
MHPLVPYLSGEAHPEGKRLASCQRCLRTGDIAEVGDNRHLTFFEMLGNWSLGDYFKEQSIAWSFEFLTSTDKGLGLNPERLYVTVFVGDHDAPRDDASILLWQQAFQTAGLTAGVDVPISAGGRIFTRGKSDNWWGPAGQTGPCGPDTEMYYDLGPVSGELVDAEGMPDLEGGRLVEIWNNVFMEYQKDAAGAVVPLTTQNVDTGMGLERIAAVVQGVDTVFATDRFLPLVAAATTLLGDRAGDGVPARIVADHLRAAVMLAADGVVPSNKEQGYILRRLLRRATLHLNLPATQWVSELVEVVVQTFQSGYPALALQQAKIEGVISEEVDKFFRTLEKGKREIEKMGAISGSDAFNLYQTYGFPLELTQEYAASRGVTLDTDTFAAEFAQHQEKSRTASGGQFASGLADHQAQTVRYHTATHLLHQALREVLGPHVQQRGSNITAERLRFDFTHPAKLTEAELTAVAQQVNDKIVANLPVARAEMSPEEATEQGYLGLFAAKYGALVSVYDIGGYSKEICTGPHVAATGELGEFVIEKEEAVGAGVRRIKATLR